jgi:hypothetical protein
LLDQITFYEESFFWTFKRFYLTLNLPNQLIQLLYTPQPTSNTPLVASHVHSSLDLRSDLLTSPFFQPITTASSTPSLESAPVGGSQKDIQLTSYERELLTSDDESILLDLLTTPTTTTVTLRPFTFGTGVTVGDTPLEFKTTPTPMFHPSNKTFTEQPLLKETVFLRK